MAASPLQQSAVSRQYGLTGRAVPRGVAVNVLVQYIGVVTANGPCRSGGGSILWSAVQSSGTVCGHGGEGGELTLGLPGSAFLRTAF
jgi:hypothetical protein